MLNIEDKIIHKIDNTIEENSKKIIKMAKSPLNTERVFLNENTHLEKISEIIYFLCSFDVKTHFKKNEFLLFIANNKEYFNLERKLSS